MFFFVKNSELFTPKPDCFLDGITRQTVIKIAKKKGIKVNEGHFKLNFLADCDEFFLTGTAVEITPVGAVDSYSFVIGETTKLLIKEFQKEVLL